jgi:hypothetical protein
MDVGSIIGGVGGAAGSAYPLKKAAQKPADSKAAGAAERSAKLDSVRERMRSGYYQSRDVDEAISDKISGAFDTLA